MQSQSQQIPNEIGVADRKDINYSEIIGGYIKYKDTFVHRRFCGVY